MTAPLPSPRSHSLPNTRPHLHLVPRPQDPPTGPDRSASARIDVFLDMGFVIRSARNAFGPRTTAQVPDPLTTALEIVNLRRWRGELGTVHVFDGIHDAARRPSEHYRMISWKQRVESAGNVVVHLQPLQYLPDGSFRQKEVDTTMAFAMDDAARSGDVDTIVAFTGDRDLVPAARRVIAADVRFESACWGQRGGIFVPEKRTWTHRLGRAAYERCTASPVFGDAA